MNHTAFNFFKQRFFQKRNFSFLKRKRFIIPSTQISGFLVYHSLNHDSFNIFDKLSNYFHSIQSNVVSPLIKSESIQSSSSNVNNINVPSSDDENDNNSKNNRPQEETIKAGEIIDDLPFYTLDEIQSHDHIEKGIWVIYKNGVYDITHFIDEHPGGKERIILASGHSIEPFWKMYQQHSTNEVMEILETLRIGNISNEERNKTVIDLNDPYANDPERIPALIVRTQKPYNAEIPPQLIHDSFITPNDLFFVRNHLPVPNIDPLTYQLTLSIENKEKTFSLTLDDLKKLPKTTVISSIQCAGNRRSDLNKVKPVKGLFWDIGAISNAEWSGVKLVDLLDHLHIKESDLNSIEHVIFEGLDCDQDKCYASSIPIDKAVSKRGDVLLAYEMNGEDIPKDHGYPIRAIAPGIVGARNVKWLGKIQFSKEECQGHWQQNDYKGFSPNVDWDNVNFSESPSIQELPVQSAITEPVQEFVIDEDEDEIKVKGYAWSGGGRGIVRVDVSIDGGKQWHTAKLNQAKEQKRGQKWAWSLWELDIPIPEHIKKGRDALDIRCKAVDDSYNVQPDTTDPIWNLRGVLSNSWHQVIVPIKRNE